jgi:hypothetical protein
LVEQASGLPLYEFAGVAQLVELQPSKLVVEGSSPFARSKKKSDLPLWKRSQKRYKSFGSTPEDPVNE